MSLSRERERERELFPGERFVSVVPKVGANGAPVPILTLDIAVLLLLLLSGSISLF